MSNRLGAIEHIVVLMLENPSFDHMLGHLYADTSPRDGQPFEGLTGDESNSDQDGNPVAVFKIGPDTPQGYLMPGADPGEGYGGLPAFTFLEPAWSGPEQNDQHPVSDVTAGERLIRDVYYAVRSNAEAWKKTLLIITCDEHGGCYDHLAPPWTATPPDDSVGEFGFDFGRFGPRLLTVLVSPLIEPGTVFRISVGATPLDHTSILKTVQTRWPAVKSLTRRDAAASAIGDVLTRAASRDDDPLQGVSAPTSPGGNPFPDIPTHLQRIHAELMSRLPVKDEYGGAHHEMPALTSHSDYQRYIWDRYERWRRSR